MIVSKKKKINKTNSAKCMHDLINNVIVNEMESDRVFAGKRL